MENIKITFVCCPKPFTTDFKDIQYNAIKSWALLKTVDKIVVCGNEEGVRDFVERMKEETESGKIEYIEKIKRTKNGTPLVDHIFKIGANHSQKHVCYINCDIILLDDFDSMFIDFIEAFPKQENFLIVGKRWDWHNPTPIMFDENWQNTVKEMSTKDGHLHSESAIDYFLHTKTTFPSIHPFAIGKFFWDNWLVGNAFRRPEVITVDVTESVFAIHQNSPWYVYNESVSQKSKATDCEEAIMNRSFESFGKNIKNGTKYYSTIKNDRNIFVKKKYSSLNK
jgi:hypothetical protein